jgi:F0F1-type ATP synthase assembly protein I
VHLRATFWLQSSFELPRECFRSQQRASSPFASFFLLSLLLITLIFGLFLVMHGEEFVDHLVRLVQIGLHLGKPLNISGEFLVRVQGFLYDVTFGTQPDQLSNRVVLLWSLILGFGSKALNVLRLLGLTELFRFRIAHWFKLYLNLSIKN